MKKAVILAGILALMLLCGCGSEAANNAPATPEPAPVATPVNEPVDDGIPTEPVAQTEAPAEPLVGIPNPMKEVTPQELGELTGVYLDAPEGVEASFYFIEGTEGSIAQMSFERDGAKVSLRVCPAGIPEGEPEDISGLFYTWENTGEDIPVANNRGYIHWNEGAAGSIYWYDFAPGLLYAVSVDTGASRTLLTQLAGELYAPKQGEVG